MTRYTKNALSPYCAQFLHQMSALSNELPLHLATDCKTIIAELSILNSAEGPTIKEALTSLLSAGERETFKKFKYPKRQNQWLGGRLALKLSINQLLSTKTDSLFLEDISILADNDGRPALQPPLSGKQLLSISISHSHDYAAATAFSGPNCGIDIQKETPQIEKVVEKFTNSEEIALFHYIDSLQAKLTMIWASKEAVKKAMLAQQPSLFCGIDILDINTPPSANTCDIICGVKTSDSLATVQVHLCHHDQYHLACTFGEKDA